MRPSIQKLFSNKIVSLTRSELTEGASINGMVALRRDSVYYLTLRFEDGTQTDLAVKVKDGSLMRKGIDMVGEGSIKLKTELIRHNKILGYCDSVKREIAIYSLVDEELKSLIIPYLGCCGSPRGGRNMVFLRCPHNGEIIFDRACGERLLDAILRFHIRYYGDEKAAEELRLNRYAPDDYRRSSNCLKMLFNKNADENLRVFGKKKSAAINSFIDSIGDEARAVSFHRSFTHNDFSLRNIFISDEKVLMYDFELSCFQNPEHDLIELLMYESGSLSDDDILALIRYYRDRLYSSVVPALEADKEMFRRILRFNMYEWIATRLSLLRIVGRKIGLDFIDGLMNNADRLSDIIEVYHD